MSEARIHKLLEDLTGRPAQMHVEAIEDLLEAEIRRNPIARRQASEHLSDLTRDTMGAAEVLGARVTLDAAAMMGQMDAGTPDATFGDDQTVLPRVTFEEGLEDLATRVPKTLRNAAQRTARSIARLYSEGRHIAFVRAAEENVTQAAKQFLERAMREGLGEDLSGRLLSKTVEEVRSMTKPWAESYSRMVYRTNLNTAVTAGRFRQAQDPVIRQVMPAFRFDAVMDSDARHNHASANGIVMAVDDVRWNRIAPPLGYNCRCQVVAVDQFTLESAGMLEADGSVRMMRIPDSVFPDDGFRHGGRPDLFTA